MKNHQKSFITAFSLILLLPLFTLSNLFAQSLPPKAEILEDMTVANRYFMEKWPDVGEKIVTNRTRVSNIWTRAVYYEGLMALYELDPKDEYYNYAVDWGKFHNWNLRNGNTYTRNADNQAAGQIYIELYKIDPKPERIKYIKASIDSMLKTNKLDDWNWVDALQMAMPVFSELGVIFDDPAYWERMYKMYMTTKTELGEKGLYNNEDHLWWRDADFDPPYTEPNGEDLYWSRGNGWVIAALVRVLEDLPEDAPHRDEYLKTFKEMAKALVPLQRDDGFWNVSLHDPNHLGGPETTGTALFAYGMAWGVNNGILDENKYRPIIVKAWNGMVNKALHPNGFLGYVQGTGKQPSDGQPVTYNRQPDFEDYGLGCFLLAGSEVYKMKATSGIID